MARFDMLPLWTDALMGDTAGMTHARFGQYMRLLIYWWRNGCEPATLDQLEDMSGIERPDLERLRRFLTPVEGDRFIQKKLFEVWAHQVGKSEKARASAEERWKGRENADAGNGDANASNPDADGGVEHMLAVSRSRSCLSKDKQKTRARARKGFDENRNSKSADAESATLAEKLAAGRSRAVVAERREISPEERAAISERAQKLKAELAGSSESEAA